jgi:hypothetical protein
MNYELRIMHYSSLCFHPKQIDVQLDTALVEHFDDEWINRDLWGYLGHKIVHT